MKFIDSFYFKNKEGITVSKVLVKHKGKLFNGMAFLHPDDEAAGVGSELTGCRYAETRARIKALKYELKVERKACEDIRKFVRAIEGYKDFDKDSPTAKVMYRQLNQRIKKVNKLIDEINAMYLGLRIAFRKQNRLNYKINLLSENNIEE